MPTRPVEAARHGSRPDAVRGRLYDLGPYPALVDLDDPGADWVFGFVRPVELGEVDGHDRWEDVEAGLYRRDRTTTRKNEIAWVYVYARPLPANARGPLDRWRVNA